jgi:Polyketide cyclase / dehydrase and lipid transport
MATIERETMVSGSPTEIWAKLISDPNHWSDWLTPVHGLEEKVASPVSEGQSFGARLGNLSGRIKVVEAVEGKKLRWKAGPGPLLAMGMGMKGTLELHAHNGETHVHLTMKSPPMMRPMMQAMTGLTTADEMSKTIDRIKELGEQRS